MTWNNLSLSLLYVLLFSFALEPRNAALYKKKSQSFKTPLLHGWFKVHVYHCSTLCASYWLQEKIKRGSRSSWVGSELWKELVWPEQRDFFVRPLACPSPYSYLIWLHFPSAGMWWKPSGHFSNHPAHVGALVITGEPLEKCRILVIWHFIVNLKFLAAFWLIMSPPSCRIVMIWLGFLVWEV